MTAVNAKPKLDKKYCGQEPGKGKQVIGIYRPDVVLPWDDEEHPTCYVVTPVLDYQPEQIHLAVLLCPSNGLCTPYQVAKDDVFYRFEYRDEITAISKRNAHGIRASQNILRALNVGKVIVDAHDDCGNEMKMLALAFKKTHEPWSLKELKQVMERTNADIPYNPHRSNKGLRAFIENNAADFTDELASALVKEVKVLWPDVELLSEKRVMKLKSLLGANNAHIKVFQLKGLLAEGLHALNQHDDGDNIVDEAAFVQDITARLDRVLGKEAQAKPSASNFIIDAESQDALLASFLAKVKSILARYDSFSEKLNGQFGDHVLEGAGPADFWAKYAEAPDTDSARLAFFQVAKFVVAEYGHSLSAGIIEPLRDMVAIMERLNLNQN